MSSGPQSSCKPLTLEKYSLGVGDRFARQARAQLRACIMAEAEGLTVVPVWNKSNREHTIVGSKPESVRAAADSAVKSLGWKHSYYIDADHISLATVDGFLKASDFFPLMWPIRSASRHRHPLLTISLDVIRNCWKPSSCRASSSHCGGRARHWSRRL
jgi:hypothetical protein